MDDRRHCLPLPPVTTGGETRPGDGSWIPITRLVAALENQLWADPDYAVIGAADAFQDLFQTAETVVPKLEGKTGQPWGWLLLRATSRAHDEQRRALRALSGVPDDQKPGLARQDLSPLDHHEGGEDPVGVAQDRETAARLRFDVLELTLGLDDIDRHIFLHDCIHRYDYYSAEKVRQIDRELLARRPEEIYTREQLKNRRQRLREKLRRFLIEWRIP